MVDPLDDTDRRQDQLGALRLVLNAIVLWTTKYIDAAVAQLEAEGYEIRNEDIARLSPLKHRNLPARPLQLHRLRPGRRHPASAAGPGRGRTRRGRGRRGGLIRTSVRAPGLTRPGAGTDDGAGVSSAGRRCSGRSLHRC
nr:transposase [Streptomyces niveus]